jgi:hypothetical protein
MVDTGNVAVRSGPRHLLIAGVLAVALVGAAALVFGLPAHAGSARPSTSSAPAARPVTQWEAALRFRGPVPEAPTTTTTTTTVVVAPVPPQPAATTPVPATSVAALVAQVEAAGIVPEPGWSWSMGDTSVPCGVIPGDNVATGCTFGPVGSERTVFAGTPTLALVAHELANAETMDYAQPSLLTEVADAAGGASWTPIDAVSSCLVEHFMGFQDGAAGTWQCPSSLATEVAEDIHTPG